MTPRVASWSPPSFPPPTGVLVGGPYAALESRPVRQPPRLAPPPQVMDGPRPSAPRTTA